MKKTSLELQLIEVSEAFEALKQAYSTDSWSDSVKESYGRLLDQQEIVLEKLNDYTEAKRGLVQDVDLEDVDKLIQLARGVCDQAGDVK